MGKQAVVTRPTQPQGNLAKEDFWSLIASAKEASGHDMNAYLQWLTEHLTELSPQSVQDFHNIFHGYQQLAYQYGLWSAAILLCDGNCTDDGFIDFRAWLIAQGKEVFLAALADPDSLSKVERYGGCKFEALSYVANKALMSMTGKSAYDGMDDTVYGALLEDLRSDITFGIGINYPYEWSEFPTYFPHLYEKYLNLGNMKHYGTIWSPDIQIARRNGPPQRSSPQIKMEMKGT